MIVKLKDNVTPTQVEDLITWALHYHIDVRTITGEINTLLGFIGDTSLISIEQVQAMDIVENVTRIQEPYKSSNRKFHPEDSVITVGNTSIGGKHITVIAGPCSVESEEQICHIAQEVKAAGATLLRGGAYKPRTSPYAFQGLRQDGIQMLLKAKEATGLPIVTEIMDISQLHHFDEVDLIQVGARNMQNFELLKELGKIDKPILLKRGLSSTIEELLMSAEYILAGGNNRVILCERGIRTFETATRNTLDLSAVPVLKKLTHLPIIVDPSHGTGKSSLVAPMSLAATAAGADGLIIEVHDNPAKALCDGPQSLTPAAFAKLKHSIDLVAAAIKQ